MYIDWWLLKDIHMICYESEFTSIHFYIGLVLQNYLKNGAYGVLKRL